MTLPTEIYSTVTSVFLKQMNILKSFNSVLYIKYFLRELFIKKNKKNRKNILPEVTLQAYTDVDAT